MTSSEFERPYNACYAHPMFSGSFTALITPFKDGAIDRPALDTLIERQIDAGTDGLVVCGTTAESPTLTAEEHAYIVERSVDMVKGRIPVLAGTGSNATAKTVDMTRHARDAGADAALIVTPYYNKPTQDGLEAHYRAVAAAVAIPIVLYNIPGRSVVDVNIETMTRLAKVPSIVGVKECSGDLSRLAALRSVRPDFALLSGEDGQILEFMAAGGDGCVSVTANLAPELCAEFHDSWRAGNKAGAKAIHDRLSPLHQALFIETSPAPVKYALSTLGLCRDDMRLPLVPASAKARRTVDEAMALVFTETQQRKVS